MTQSESDHRQEVIQDGAPSLNSFTTAVAKRPQHHPAGDDGFEQLNGSITVNTDCI